MASVVTLKINQNQNQSKYLKKIPTLPKLIINEFLFMLTVQDLDRNE